MPRYLSRDYRQPDMASLCVKTRRPSARPRLLPGEPFQRGPIAHGPTMTKWIGKASLTMRSPRRIVLSYRFHIGRTSLCSPFYEVIGRIDEDLDPGRRQAPVRRARLLILTRHSFVEEERRAIEVKPSNAVKIPQLAGAKSEEHTSELQALRQLVCRLLLDK